MTHGWMIPQIGKRHTPVEYSIDAWLLLQKDGYDEAKEERKKMESMQEMIQYSGVAGTHHRGVREKDHLLLCNDENTPFVPSVKILHSHNAHYRSQLSRYTAGADMDGSEKSCQM